MANKLIVTAAPHITCADTTQKIMQRVCLALVPTLAASVFVFGINSLILTAITVIACVAFEYGYCKMVGREVPVSDFSAVVTGMLLAFNLPASLPWWMAIVGAFIAIVIVKQLFGGMGYNFANPAIVARIALAVGFASKMSSYPHPNAEIDAIASATPLAVVDQLGADSYVTLLLGNHGGVLGETCAITLLLGGIYLIVTKVISPNVDYEGENEPTEEDIEKEPLGETPKKDVKTFTTALEIVKTDPLGNRLVGAEFTLTGETMNRVRVEQESFELNETGAYWKLKDGSYTTTDPNSTIDGAPVDQTKYENLTDKYVKTTTTTYETKADGPLTITATVGADGTLRFEGLKEGNYTITETKAPTGYNPLTETVQVEITWNEETFGFEFDGAVDDNGIAGKCHEQHSVSVAIQFLF